MCRQSSNGEIKGCFSLLVKKANGKIIVGSDEKHLDGIVCFFNYLISKVKEQDFFKKYSSKKSFKAYSTRKFLGEGYENLKLIIKEKERELFVLEKTENQLVIIRKTDFVIDLNFLDKLILDVVKYFKLNSLIDSENGFIIYGEDIESIHSISISVINNDINIYNLYI